jgi:hypothetical protein
MAQMRSVLSKLVRNYEIAKEEKLKRERESAPE